MSAKDLSIAIVGAGGDGVVSLGDMLAQAAAGEGLHVIKTEAYGPQIRGGESSCTVRISATPITAQGDFVDVLVVFSWPDFARFKSEIIVGPDAVIFCDDKDAESGIALQSGQREIRVPLAQLAKTSAGTPAAKNIIALGILAEAFGLPKDPIRKAIEKKFGKKKKEVLESNLRAWDAGRTLGSSLGDFSAKGLQYVPSEPKLLMSGNEATALGALHAGCRFFAGYPITPSSEILHFLGEWLPGAGGGILQTEDELAAIGAVVGASFAGVKAMTATSGPGLSLMSEMLGLASIAEIPAVVVNVQRGGPSTGIPTKSEQSDLWHAVYSGHGDMPRVVLACSDVEDSFHTTVDAFNIAEEFQIPVIVLSDQLIGQRRETLSIDALTHPVIDRQKPSSEELEEYRRYRETDSGVSPMSVPGSFEGIYQTNGLEHDEHGRPSAMYLMHERMNAKRHRKLWAIREKYNFVRRYGPEKAELGIVCWGSSKGPVKEAVLRANARGDRVAAFVPQVLFPFPKRELEEFVKSVDTVLVLELSYAAQFYKYLKTFVELPEETTHVYKRSGGKPLTVAEVDEQIRIILDIFAEVIA
ncbi:MAG TPA: 2-oxoacid:acceptor oxidoreductase subunit alpha [Thermoanaerobaculia bacterium]